MTRRYLLPLLALLSSAPAANGAPEPPRQEDRTPAGAAQPTDGASNPSPPYDLRSIARREAEREEAMLTARVRALIQELRTTGDPNVALIQQRLAELSQ